jgi:hypothetical protein
MNACPYLANLFFHQRPQVQSSIGATSILTQGAGGSGHIGAIYSKPMVRGAVCSLDDYDDLIFVVRHGSAFYKLVDMTIMKKPVIIMSNFLWCTSTEKL